MQSIFVIVSKFSPNLEQLEILEDRDKSYKVRNVDNNATCFIPKSGLKPRKPGVPTYENEFILAGWFRNKLNHFQERALGIVE